MTPGRFLAFLAIFGRKYPDFGDVNKGKKITLVYARRLDIYNAPYLRYAESAPCRQGRQNLWGKENEYENFEKREHEHHHRQ